MYFVDLGLWIVAKSSEFSYLCPKPCNFFMTSVLNVLPRLVQVGKCETGIFHRMQGLYPEECFPVGLPILVWESVYWC